MKSLKKFKNRIVEDKDLSHRITDCSPSTVKKIYDITASSYKLDSKSTNRGRMKTDHSLEKKSPIRIPQQYLKSNDQFKQEAKLDSRFGQQFFSNLASIPAVYTTSSRGHCKSVKSVADEKETRGSVLLNSEQLEGIRDIWRSIHKLEGKKEISREIQELKGIMNKICQRGLKPEFRQYHQQSTQRVIRVPSMSSNIVPDSHQKEYPVDSIAQSKISNSQQNFSRTPSPFTSQQCTPENNIEYKKILYMLDRNSQDSICPVRCAQTTFGNEPQNQRVIEVISRMECISDEESEDREQREHETAHPNNKRAVLRNIVDMLNTKYNKNIKIK